MILAMVRYFALALVLLDAYFTRPTHVLHEWGFGVGITLGVFTLLWVSHRYSSLKAVTTLISLIFVFLLFFSQLFSYEDRRGLAHGVGELYFGLLTLGLETLVAILVGYLLREGFVGVMTPCLVLFNSYTRSLFSIGFAYFLLFSALTPVFLPHYSITAGFLVFQIVTWLVIVARSARIDDSALAQFIRQRGLGQFDLKTQVRLFFLGLLLLGTLFESFRGLWKAWLGTAVLLTLMSLSFWKMLRHVLAVPAESTTKLRPPDPEHGRLGMHS